MRSDTGWLKPPAALAGFGLLLVMSAVFIAPPSAFIVLFFTGLAIFAAAYLVFFAGLIVRRMLWPSCISVLGVGAIIYSRFLQKENLVGGQFDPSEPPLFGGLALCLAVFVFVYLSLPLASKLVLRRGGPGKLSVSVGIIAIGSAAFTAGLLWGLAHFMSEVNHLEAAIANFALLGGLGVATTGWILLGVQYTNVGRSPRSP
jgi:drug/metabolite transporter (DMT)-like permease